MAADGEQNVRIAQRLDVHVGVVSMWRKRFHESHAGQCSVGPFEARQLPDPSPTTALAA